MTHLMTKDELGDLGTTYLQLSWSMESQLKELMAEGIARKIDKELMAQEAPDEQGTADN